MRLAVLIVLLVLVAPATPAGTLRVAVAANFKPVLAALNADFEQRWGHHVSLSSASTGVLYNQISHGAPFDLFLAADAETPRRLAVERATSSICYARGQLVLVGADSLSALADPGLALALANPATAPYGRAAAAVIERPEFSAGRSRKLVRGNNVAQAYQLWYSGGIDLALLPRSLVPGQGIPVPADWHQPLDQHAVLLNQDSAPARAYLDWLRSDTVQNLIVQAGYDHCP